MLKKATIRVTSFVCVMIAAGSAFGQTSEFPYTGMINGTMVRVRAGRGDPSGANNYYYCAVLNAPAKVTVVGSEKGWLKVLPPEGCYSVVLASAVKPDLTGTSGTMIKREWARAAGTARTAQFTAGQAILKAGATVEIIGSVVDRFKFYKIKPPSNVRFWIYATYVDKVGTVRTGGGTTGAGTTTARTGGGATTKPPTGGGTTSGSGTTVVKKPAAPQPAGVTKEQMAEFKATQAALRKEYAKPVVERDYAGLIERFEAIPLEKDNPLVPFVQYYVKYIQADMDRLASIVAARKLTTDAADAQREFDAARANVTITVPPKPVVYAAEGIVGASRMFTGTSAVHKRYILYVNKTHQLNAYIYTTNPMVNLAGLVGQHVGVFGTVRYDAGLGTKIIDVNRVETIADQVGVPARDKPVVREMPVRAKPSETPISPLVVPRPVDPGTTKKPMPLTDLVPKPKPVETTIPAPKPVTDPPKPKPVPVPEPVTTPPSSVGAVGTPIEVVAPLPPELADRVAAEMTTPKPVEVAKPTPVEIAEPVPVEITKPVPIEITKPKPIEIAKPVPVEITKPKPVEVAKPVPVEITRPVPVEITKPKPIEIAKPVPVEITKPKPVEVAKPIPVEIAKPKPIELAPTPVEIAKPKPIEVARPVPVEITKPKPIEITQPTPVEIAKPKPVEVTKPSPVELVQPKPIEIAKPTPVEILKPKPVEIAKPIPVEIAKPQPVEITAPKPVEITRPKPVEIAKPIPIEVAKPKPIGITTPKPVEIAKPVPVEVAKPKPIGIAKPIPVEIGKPKPVEVGKPGGLIDLESIGKRPTTRPASAIEAIPAPVKKVNPEDFPMPLPPSGLPLVDVKKTPTTVPVDTSEFE